MVVELTQDSSGLEGLEEGETGFETGLDSG
jgi:hypothetical protein